MARGTGRALVDNPNTPLVLHWQALPRRQLTALRSLAPVAAAEGFYLAGGTALALILGHRRSVDLDWFTEKPLLEPLALAQRIGRTGLALERVQVAPGTLYGVVAGVSVSFLEYHYPFLQPPVSDGQTGCLFASIEDIAAMKLAAIVGRGARKDFLDVYAIGLKQFPLAEMLHLYQRKFGVEDILHVQRALSYFDDADKERTPHLLWSMPWRTVKATIRGWVKELAP